MLGSASQVVSKLVEPVSKILQLKPPAQSGLMLSGGVIGGLNLAGFILTAAFETHKLTDLVGVSSFVASALVCAFKAKSWGAIRTKVLNICISLWGVRLAGYLFPRVLQVGGDDRLEKFYPEKGERWLDSSKSFYPVGLSMFWSIQALWGWIVSFPITMANFAPRAGPLPLQWHGKLFLGTFIGGLLVESVADYQKWVFKSNPKNKDKWIEDGLWKYSRHPNYFGEIIVWWSLFGLSFPLLRGTRQVLLGLASPIFTSFLLTKVSGIPLLEQKYDKKYSGNKEFLDYRSRTNVLIPWFPCDLNDHSKKSL